MVSSRDALEAALPEVVGSRQVASLGPMARQLGIAGELTFAADPDLFERAECFAFLGSAGWDEALQARLEAALSRGDVDLLVGNPDISAPLGGAFSAEPGYWALRAMQATGVRPYWYGKPYPDAFDLVLARLESTQGRSFDRRRVAMVGDSLHTDILGARAAGLQAVLLTGYGLFSDGGAQDTIRACASFRTGSSPPSRRAGDRQNDDTPPLSLEGLACDCRIGAYDHERLAPQRVIDAEIELSGPGEPTSDRLEDTLNYDLIRGSILEIAGSQHFDLQETLARRLRLAVGASRGACGAGQDGQAGGL